MTLIQKNGEGTKWPAGQSSFSRTMSMAQKPTKPLNLASTEPLCHRPQQLQRHEAPRCSRRLHQQGAQGERKALDEPEGQLWSRPQSGPCLGCLQPHRALQPRSCACLRTPAVPERRKLRLAKPKNRLVCWAVLSFYAYFLERWKLLRSPPGPSTNDRSARGTAAGQFPCPAEPERQLTDLNTSP